MNYTNNEIKHILSQKLPSKRYLHVLGVCDTAAKMAHKFGIDEQKAYLAALLHDCVKYMATSELIEYANNLGVKLSGEDIECPQVIHAPLGAQIAKVEYGVEDNEILDAIKYHTVARENMTKLDMIIYVADMIEPTRNFDGVEDLRKIAFENLEKGFIECLKTSLMFNIKADKKIHSNSLKCWNSILKKGSNI